MIRCYIDTRGKKRVDATGIHPLVETFLEQDIQSSIASCDGFLQLLSDVMAGVQDACSGCGNAHSVEITREGVEIECLWDSEMGVANLPIDVFRQCVEQWRDFLVAQRSQ